MSSLKRSAAVAAAAAAALLLPATAASAQETEIPEEGWEYSEAWDFKRDKYTVDAQIWTEEALDEHFGEWTFDNSLEMIALQNYAISYEHPDLVQRKFRGDFYVDQTGEGLEIALYVPGGIKDGIAYPDEEGQFEPGHLVYCQETDTECAEEELEDGTVVAWTTDGTYVDATAFFPDGSAATVWWGQGEDEELHVTPSQITELVVDLDTTPVWNYLRGDKGD